MGCKICGRKSNKKILWISLRIIGCNSVSEAPDLLFELCKPHQSLFERWYSLRQSKGKRSTTAERRATDEDIAAWVTHAVCLAVKHVQKGKPMMFCEGLSYQGRVACVMLVQCEMDGDLLCNIHARLRKRGKKVLTQKKQTPSPLVLAVEQLLGASNP